MRPRLSESRLSKPSIMRTVQVAYYACAVSTSRELLQFRRGANCVLTIKEKLEIVALLQRGTSYTVFNPRRE